MVWGVKGQSGGDTTYLAVLGLAPLRRACWTAARPAGLLLLRAGSAAPAEPAHRAAAGPEDVQLLSLSDVTVNVTSQQP